MLGDFSQQQSNISCLHLIPHTPIMKSKTEEAKIEALMQAELLETPPPPYIGQPASPTSSSSSASSNTGLLYPVAPPTDQIIVMPQISPQKYQAPFHDLNKQPRKRGWFIDTISEPEAWLATFYFIFIGFPIAVFAFCWCVPTVVCGIVSWIFPPVGIFIWTG